jgi:nucleoid-associated protein YejK
MVFQKKKCILLRQTLGDIMKWEDILKISNRKAREIAYEYARADYDAGNEENAERLSKPVVEEIDKFSDIIREYMADTTGKAKERFEETLDALRYFRGTVFKDGKYHLNTSADVERMRKRLIPVKKFLVRQAGIPSSEFSWFK